MLPARCKYTHIYTQSMVFARYPSYCRGGAKCMARVSNLLKSVLRNFGQLPIFHYKQDSNPQPQELPDWRHSQLRHIAINLALYVIKCWSSKIVFLSQKNKLFTWLCRNTKQVVITDQDKIAVTQSLKIVIQNN